VKVSNTESVSEEDTQSIARQFAASVASSDVRPIVVYLSGELGAGKSVFARAVLRALGVTSAIKSPTYTLVEHYPIRSAEHHFRAAAHLDLYRLVDPEELYFIGFDDVVSGSDLLLIEWAEKGAGQLPEATHEVIIEYAQDARQVRVIEAE